ncbi:hypothetical protein Acid345_3375 [Candidatus Koribacter versatilis Ellin345]|uniref:Uncharacterized protein n=1 Tax=Koribacter versatilis (strain Ellin345) TaxID=204669 RepID=Q1IL74_KORVE|nr:hypothetical protein [Candidatus Koribacter versatilis]ABF42376.1 hypothetical protein Acid345_3375 [Candidatus Koribacter versatilis Ellin345]
MPRQCARAGCNEILRDKNGDYDYTRMFHSPECGQQDRKEKLAQKRAKRLRKGAVKEARKAARELPPPTWITIRGKRVGLATPKTALQLAKLFPEILNQLGTEPVKAKKRRKR